MRDLQGICSSCRSEGGVMGPFNLEHPHFAGTSFSSGKGSLSVTVIVFDWHMPIVVNSKFQAHLVGRRASLASET